MLRLLPFSKWDNCYLGGNQDFLSKIFKRLRRSLEAWVSFKGRLTPARDSSYMAGRGTLSEGKANWLCICLWVNFACGQIWLSAAETWYSSALQAVPNSHFSIKLCINTCLSGKAFLHSVLSQCSGPSSPVPSRVCPTCFAQRHFHINRVLWDAMELAALWLFAFQSHAPPSSDV